MSFPRSAIRSAGKWLTADLPNLDRDARRRGYARGIVFIVVAVAVAYLIYTHLGDHHNQYDLKIYYNAVRYWLDGNSLYDYSQPDPVNISLGFTYPPIAAIVMVPMALLPIGVVVVVTFLAIIVCNTVLAYLYTRERISLPRFQMLIVSGVVSALSFCLLPIGQNVGFGQINIFLALLVVADVLVLGRRNSRWFGVGIGLAMAIKLTPGIFLLYLVLSKKWRALAVSIAAGVAAVILAGIFSFSDSVKYYTQLIWDSDRVGFLDNTTNQSINGIIARFMSPELPSRAIWMVCSVAMVGLVGWRIKKAVDQHDTLAALTLTGLLGILVSPVSWLHHVVWVLPAGIIVAFYLCSIPGHNADHASRPTTRDIVGIAALTATGLFVWLINTRLFFDLPDTNYSQLGLLKILAGSLQCLWTIAAVMVLPIRRSSPATAAPTPTGAAAAHVDGKRRSG